MNNFGEIKKTYHQWYYRDASIYNGGDMGRGYDKCLRVCSEQSADYEISSVNNEFLQLKNCKTGEIITNRNKIPSSLLDALAIAKRLASGD